MFGKLRCLATGHAIDRHRVWHDGLNNRARCMHCKTPMIRQRGEWVPFAEEQHGGLYSTRFYQQSRIQ